MPDVPGTLDRAAYLEFLQSKFRFVKDCGHAIPRDAINPMLKPHQQDLVQWAARKGRAALFAAFGLGKSFMQLELCRLLLDAEPGRALIVLPLGVRQEFTRDADKLGIAVRFVRRSDEVDTPGIYLTNYESVRDGKLDLSLFRIASLDEASVLRSYGSKTYQEFLPLFAAVPFRFVATATPSPNSHKELIHYAGFLGVMDTGQALAQPLDAKVLTPIGWIEMGDISPGDLIVAADGSPTEVLGVYPQGEKDIYRVTFSDGSYTRCTGDHLWLTRTQYERNNERRYRLRGGSERDYWTTKNTDEIARTLTCDTTSAKNHQVPMVRPVQFQATAPGLDPWLLGVLLGDGHLRDSSVTFATVDAWLVDRVGDKVASAGLVVTKVPHIRADGRASHDYTISCGGGKGSGGGRGHETNAVLRELRRLGLLGKRAWDKRIPGEFLFGTVATRHALLQGLMDTDGTISADGDNPRFLTCSEGLAGDVRALVQSLGGVATVSRREPTGMGAEHEGRLICRRRPLFVVAVSLPNEFNPFAMPRKLDRVVSKTKYFPTRYIVAVERVGVAPAQCIAVAHPDRLYVTDDFVVTHNTRFFQRDSEKANNLTLYPHMEREFHLWLHSWAAFVQRPSDLGHSDDGYTMPAMDVRVHFVQAPQVLGVERDGQGVLVRDAAMGLADAAREKRESIPARIAKLQELLAEAPNDHVIIWHDLEAERHAIKAAVPAVSEIYGTLDLDERERRTNAFADGELQYVATKPELSGSGTNWQRHCHRAVFLGIGYKFNDFIQACHRIQRFLQPHQVRIDIIVCETEREVWRTLERKWEEHRTLTDRMSDLIGAHGLATEVIEAGLARTIGIKRREECGSRYTLAHNDTVLECDLIEADSQDLIVTSIPFGNHYEYTATFEDFGHNDDNARFFAQMDHLTPNLLRILAPGRMACIHVKDRIRFGNVTGYGMPSVEPFHADCIAHYRRHGFIYCGMITVVTDVVRENNQTYRLGWTENGKDGTKMGVGCPEYVLLFRKLPSDLSRSYADVPVVKSKADYSRARWQVDAHSFWRSSGDRFLTAAELEGYGPDVLGRVFTDKTLQRIYDYRQHVAVGEALEARDRLPATFMAIAPGSHQADVWHNVNRMRTLNGAQSHRNLAMHVCPLQFDIVDRLIERFSSAGEMVFDPFAGLSTVSYCALKLGRRGRGVELNADYFRDGLRYLREAEREATAPTLFDFEALRQPVQVAAE